MSTDPLGVDLDVAVITPVYRNEDTLPELARRLASAGASITMRTCHVRTSRAGASRPARAPSGLSVQVPADAAPGLVR